MAARRTLPQKIQDLVRHRADGLCEYCHTAEKWQYVSFTIDHVIPLANGGTNDIENLALACFHCNRNKSSLSQATDPNSNALSDIYNPRQSSWADHFIWSTDGSTIIGLTTVGRATIRATTVQSHPCCEYTSGRCSYRSAPTAG